MSSVRSATSVRRSEDRLCEPRSPPRRPYKGVKHDFGVPRILPQAVQVTLCFQPTGL